MIFQPQKAIDTALKILLELGIDINIDIDSSLPLSESQQKIYEQQKFIKSFLEDKGIENLANLPIMSDRKKIAAITILQYILPASNTINFPLFIELILTFVTLCIEHGNPPQASLIYGHYGMILCGVIKEIEDGYDFGKLSLILLDKNNSPELMSISCFMIYGYIYFWKNKLNDKVSQEQFIQGLQQGINTGNHEYVSILSQGYCSIRFLAGYHLDQIEEDHEKYIQLAKKVNQEYSINFLELCRNTAKNLREYHQSEQCLLLKNSPQEEALCIKEYISQRQYWLLFLYYFGKAFDFYFLKAYDESLKNSQLATQYVVVTIGAVSYNAQHNFYYCAAHGGSLQR